MTKAAELALRPELDSAETLLWAGRPRQGVILRTSDVFLVPFSLLWCGFAIFWESGVISSHAPFFFEVWGIPFVLIGIYFVIGRFAVDSLTRGQTFYGVSTQRIIIASGLFRRTTKSLGLRTLHDISMDQSRNGTGTINFGPTGSTNWLSNSGWPGSGAGAPPRFEMIPEVKKVYETIRRAQHDA